MSTTTDRFPGEALLRRYEAAAVAAGLGDKVGVARWLAGRGRERNEIYVMVRGCVPHEIIDAIIVEAKLQSR